MKSAAFLAIAVLLAAGPAFAHSHHYRHNASYRMSRHHHSYQWNYHNEGDERRATADLNRQYRGVPNDR